MLSLKLKKEHLFSWLLFLLILDSGGWLGVREFTCFILLIISVFRIKKYHIHDKRLIYILMIITSIVLSIFLNLSSIQFLEALMFAAPILVAPIFYIYSRANILHSESLCQAGLIFSYFLIVFYFGVQFELGIFLNMHSYLIEMPSSGYFGHTLSAVTGSVEPGFYFRCTLLLVPVSLILLIDYQRWNFIICFLALTIADTRAGILTVLMFASFILMRQYINLRVSTLLVVVVSCFLAWYLYINVQIEQVLGLATRLLHIDSILNTMQYENKILGMGPSSSFFSEGFGFWTNDSEVSPFEYYRRYGIVGVITFHAFVFCVVVRKINTRKKEVIIPILSFYTVSLTNPVMASSFAFLLYFGISRRQNAK